MYRRLAFATLRRERERERLMKWLVTVEKKGDFGVDSRHLGRVCYASMDGWMGASLLGYSYSCLL